MSSPGPLRTVRLLAGLLLRRLANRIGSRWRRRRKSAGASSRTGTGRKGSVGWVGAAFIALIMGINALNLSSALLRNVSQTMGPAEDAEGRIKLSTYDYIFLQRQDERYSGDHSAYAQQELRKIFVNALRYAPRNREAHITAMMRQFNERGLNGFTERSGRDSNVFLPRLAAWQSPSQAPQIAKAIGALLLLFFLAWLFMDFGTANQDLGKVEWTMEWLFTMPVSSAGLFTAQLLGFAATEPLMWCGAWPVMIAIFVSAGWGWWSILLGAAVALYLSVLVASLRVFGETVLRCNLAPSRLKNLQALFSVLGIIGLFLVIANIGDNTISTTFLAWTLQMPDFLGSLPVALTGALPAFGVVPNGNTALAIMGASLIGAPLIAVLASAWLVRGGLITVSGAYAGKRVVRAQAFTSETRDRPPLFRGVTGKDLRLLMRDRNFLVQTLVVPVMVIGFQMIIHGGMIDAVRTQFQQAAVLAFAVGAYVLIATGMGVLSVEGNSLWMLYTFPRAIPEILLRKTKLWAGVALLYTILTLTICAWSNPHLKPSDGIFALLALTGVLIYAFIASGIGILATDPLETEVRRRVRPEMVQMYMILAAMYAHALYSASAWTRLAQIVLSTLLAFALWQKVRDRVPFLLDPIVSAAPSISLSDGLIATLAFFVLQGILQLTFVNAGMAAGAALFVAFVVAGACVVLLSLYVFRRAGVRGVFASVGLRKSIASKGMAHALILGALGGICAAAFGCAYLRAIDWVPALHDLKVHTLKLPFELGLWLPCIAVGAAPVFEEFIFRGLVFRGLLRSTTAPLAILGSAAIFAIVHPPISVIPVFILGTIAAWTVYRSGLLVSAILAHMIYNAAIFAMNWYIR